MSLAFQKMLDSKLIMHASQSEAQCFVDGMYLFFVKSAEKTDGWFAMKNSFALSPIMLIFSC